jgi:hypothetical protein
MRVFPVSLPDISTLLSGDFDEAAARELYAQGEEVVVWVMLQLAALATCDESVAPSLSTPLFEYSGL